MAEILRTENLTKRFRGLVANENIDFSLNAGEVRCVIGPNGAGKTTFISMISGHQRPSAGTIWFKEQDITELSVAERARIGISRKFQTPTVFNNLTVYENVELAVLGTDRSRRTRHARILEVIDMVQLTEFTNNLVATLSHGQRQWLEIGLLIGNDAQLLLLDEPTAGMTAEETRSTGNLVRKLAKDLSLTAIIIEHDIKFLRYLQAPVTVFHLGRKIKEGSFEEISQDEHVRNVYLGNE